MDTLTLENVELVWRAFGKIAYNMWPVIVAGIAWAIWEYIDEADLRRIRRRAKNRNAKNRYSTDK